MHFDRALALVDDGQIGEALVEFRRSYELLPHFAVLYNIAQANIALARPVDALDALERYIEQGGASIAPERRAEVEREIARQKGRIATLRIEARPEGAAVEVDGRPVGRAPLAAPVRLGVGTHAIRIALEGRPPIERSVTLAGEDDVRIELVIVGDPPVEKAPPSAAPALPPAAPVAHERAPDPRYRIGGLVVAGVGVAGLLAGAGLFASASAKHDDAVAQWDAGTRDAARRTQSDAEARIGLANVMLIGGGALAAAGAVLYLLAPSKDRPVSAYVGTAPGMDRLSVLAGGTW